MVYKENTIRPTLGLQPARHDSLLLRLHRLPFTFPKYVPHHFFHSRRITTTLPSLNGPTDVKSRSTHSTTASQPSSSSIPYSSATSPVSSASLTINALTSSPLFTSIASLSKLCARVITLLVETRPREGWVSIHKVLARFQDITSQIDSDWSKSPLARGLDDEPEIRECCRVQLFL